MSTASARAEARRKAILSRGSDRLAKLTTSARGEDSPVYTSDTAGSRSTSRTFLGEDRSDMPAPKPLTPEPESSSASTTAPHGASQEPAGLGRSGTPDPSVWSPEQQQRFMRALMDAGNAPPGEPPLQSPLGDPSDPIDMSLPPMDNPLAALLFPQAQQQTGMQQMRLGAAFDGARAASPAHAALRRPSRLQGFVPFVHLLAVWGLLLFFVVWYEPAQYAQRVGNFVDLGGRTYGVWDRWANLLTAHPSTASIVRPTPDLVPFFWAFLTLQVTLHSARIFSKQDAIEPPKLVRLALPYVPPPYSAYIIRGLKYFQMISAFLDDIAILIVGLGLLICTARLFSSAP